MISSARGCERRRRDIDCLCLLVSVGPSIESCVKSSRVLPPVRCSATIDHRIGRRGISRLREENMLFLSPYPTHRSGFPPGCILPIVISLHFFHLEFSERFCFHGSRSVPWRLEIEFFSHENQAERDQSDFFVIFLLYRADIICPFAFFTSRFPQLFQLDPDYCLLKLPEQDDRFACQESDGSQQERWSSSPMRSSPLT